MVESETTAQLDLFSETRSESLAPSDQDPKITSVCKRCGESFLSDLEVAKRYNVSRATIWRWVQAKVGFPAPIRLGQATSRWKMSDLVGFEDQNCSGGCGNG